VSGSGIFVSGAGDRGGDVAVDRLETDAVYSNGGIAAGTANQISGGVFVVHSCHVGSVLNVGPVTTYGPNDMVLDNWGNVDRWVVRSPVASFGSSAMVFVNFGVLHELRIDASIETFGTGARGFNVYDGIIQSAEFHRIVTHGDGAVGIQISKPVGSITVRSGIETFGGVGDSLVKGVVTRLPAIALSIKPAGSRVRSTSPAASRPTAPASLRSKSTAALEISTCRTFGFLDGGQLHIRLNRQGRNES
jgi:hypothetical protein